MAIFVVLGIDVFLLSDENDWDLFNSVGVGDAVVLLKMHALVDVIQNWGYITWVEFRLLLSLMEEQTGMNFPYLFWWMFP